jgi:enoyl-CoA hydratase/carnithine racemase
LESLYGEIREVLSEGGCRCLGITGEGRSFAVGADLEEVSRLTPPSAKTLSDLANGTFRLLEGADFAVVAGVDGFCLGGGLDLALAADWRMASSSSVFGHTGADLGIITGFGGTQRLGRLVGERRSFMWISTASRLGAREAYCAGFLQEVCSPERFRDAFENRVKTFSRLSVEWVRAVKSGFRNFGDGPKGSREVLTVP